MPTIDDLTHELTAHHRAAPSLRDLRERRIRRHRRRGATITAGLAVIVGASLAGPVALGTEPVEEVAITSSPTDQISDAVQAPEVRDLTIDPTGPLRAGQTVLVDLPGIGTDTTPLGKDPVDPDQPAPPSGPFITIAQCDASVVEYLGRSGEQTQIEDRCMGQVLDSSVDVSFLVMGDAMPWAAFMDGLPNEPGTARPCADQPGQCVLIATVGARGFGADPDTAPTEAGPWYTTPLEIASGEFTPPPVTARIVDLPTGGVPDGSTVVLDIEHLTPGTWAWAQQCRATSGPPTKEDCHQENLVTSTVADGRGNATLTITVSGTIPTDAVGSVTCGTCAIWVGPVEAGDGQPSLVLPLDLTE